MMGRLCDIALVSLLIVFLLNTESAWAKRGGSSSGKKTSSSSSWNNRGGTQSKPSQPGSYPRQPQSPNRNPNPYPAGGSYPGAGNTNPGGVPRQNPPNYPGVGSNPNQYPGRANPGGYPNQNPAGGYPAGGYPNQNPGRGNYPHQNPPAGGYPAGGSYPGRPGNPGGYPNQNPAGGYPAGGYPAGGYPAGGYPGAGGYPNRGGVNPGGYPAGGYPAGGYPAGGYPVRGGNTGQGWGQPGWGQAGGYPGGYPGGGVGGYTNWNPNNKILSPRYGGGYGYGGGHGMGGSPFSRSVQNMGYAPKSSGFAKKAMLAAGVGAVAGMAVGYGLGRFPRPHFSFRNPEEEYYYNNYMYRRYGTQSTDEKDYGRDYVYKPPPRAESYDKFMDNCMNRTDTLKDQRSGSTTPKSQGEADDDDDTVSIEEIGYPALIVQVKARRCVEQYMVYSERFLQERKAEQQVMPSGSSPINYGAAQLFTSLLMLLSSMLLLQ
ncbi:prisilkin-39-like isoform X2 [Epinephelus fuscoguttatus]|uniref:prisilkin-39-like isoform X2 n=1 Tax=Epinephelus fuscoguttatus TaxID=293821 RepID=UPI0020D15974|nr:prisilkin-39-like isoform X2 [Epinephelus fuscoguttatus]